MSALTPRLREKFNLPDHVLDLYRVAKTAEICHHIFEGCGFDITSIDCIDHDEIVNGVMDDENHSDESDSLFSLSMRSFARHVAANGGEANFGLTEHSLSDWK